MPDSTQQQTPPGRRALLVVNENSRRGIIASEEATPILRDAGFDVEVARTSSPQDGATVLQERRAHRDLVVVAGGDGTLHSLATSLMQAGLPLGILPLGTANDLARGLGLPTTVPGACQVIIDGHKRPIDVGWANGTRFFNAVNIGVGVALTRRLSREKKRRWGILSYCLTALETARDVRPFDVEVICGDESLSLRTVHIAVANNPHHGGVITVDEDAAVDDGQLYLYSVAPLSLWEIAQLLPALRSGRMREHDRVQMLRSREIEIHTEKPKRVIADGEPAGRTPVRIRIERAALTVFAPADPNNPPGA